MTHDQQCGPNSLEEILTYVKRSREIVIRWCPQCGAIVVDTDYDGRTSPGAIMKMRFPTNNARNPTRTASEPLNPRDIPRQIG